MSELPPLSEVLHMLRTVVGPCAAAAAGVFGGVLLLARLVTRRHWRLVAPPASVVALAAAMAVGNTGPDRPFPWAPDGKPWHEAWHAVGLALAVEFAARLPGVAVGAANLLRGLAAGVIAAMVVPAAWVADDRWWVAAFAAPVAVQWAVVDAVGRRSPGGSTAAAVAVACGGAATVLLHVESLGFLTVCTFVASALGAIAVLAWATGTDGNSAAAVGTVPVAVMLLLGRYLRDTAVPNASFDLVGLTPLALGLFLLPPLARFNGRLSGTALKVLVVLVPVAVGVYLAMDAAPYRFGELEEDW